MALLCMFESPVIDKSNNTELIYTLFNKSTKHTFGSPTVQNCPKSFELFTLNLSSYLVSDLLERVSKLVLYFE
jgi:hypothetical protein